MTFVDSGWTETDLKVIHLNQLHKVDALTKDIIKKCRNLRKRGTQL